LRACARALVAEHGGEFPADIEAVTRCRGSGDRPRARFWLSRGVREPILEGNVKPGAARVFGIAGDPNSATVLAALWLQSVCVHAGGWGRCVYAGIMDLGATLCSRSSPACHSVPHEQRLRRASTRRNCRGRKAKRARGSREATLLIAEAAAKVDRGAGGAAADGGLWAGCGRRAIRERVRRARLVPAGDREPKVQPRALAPIHHAFTHFGFAAQSVARRCQPGGAAVHEGDDRLWYRLGDPPRVGLPQPIRALFERFRARPRAVSVILRHGTKS